MLDTSGIDFAAYSVPVVFFLAIGTFLDRALVSERKGQDDSKVDEIVDLPTLLRVTYFSFFVRFLRGHPFSPQFLLKSTVVSIVLMGTFVVFLQSGEQPFFDLSDPFQRLLILTAVMANIPIDVFCLSITRSILKFLSNNYSTRNLVYAIYINITVALVIFTIIGIASVKVAFLLPAYFLEKDLNNTQVELVYEIKKNPTRKDSAYHILSVVEESGEQKERNSFLTFEAQRIGSFDALFPIDQLILVSDVYVEGFIGKDRKTVETLHMSLEGAREKVEEIDLAFPNFSLRVSARGALNTGRLTDFNLEYAPNEVLFTVFDIEKINKIEAYSIYFRDFLGRLTFKPYVGRSICYDSQIVDIDGAFGTGSLEDCEVVALNASGVQRSYFSMIEQLHDGFSAKVPLMAMLGTTILSVSLIYLVLLFFIIYWVFAHWFKSVQFFRVFRRVPFSTIGIVLGVTASILLNLS